MWEAWRIEARTSDPTYKNLLCVVLRRKFIPPFYSTFQVFHFILTEEISREFYEINPRSNEILELAVDSIAYSEKIVEKEYILFIKASIDSLMIEEESMYFLQNSLNVFTQEIYDLGFEFLYSILCLLESNTKEKTKILPIRLSLEQKIRTLNNSGEITFEL